MPDALIVGAGPVGRYIAQKLAGLGYEVEVFEDHKVIGEPVQCSGIIGRECFERFDMPQNIVLTESKSAKFFSPTDRCLKLATDGVQAYIIDRKALDEAMAQRARDAGATYHLSTKVIDISMGDDGVQVTTSNGSNLELHYAKVVIIASGFGSKLPYSLGLGRVSYYIAGAQMEVDITGVDEVELYFSQRIAPGFFGWLIPTGGGKGLAGLFARSRPRQHLSKMIGNLRSKGKITTEGKITAGGVPLKPLARTYAERVLVGGDAAGQVKPTTGGGVYYGLLCADIAVDTLHQSFISNDFSKKTMSSYQKAWRKRLGRELKMGYLARRLYAKMNDRQIETLFKIAESKGIAHILMESKNMRFDWHGGLLLESLKQIGPWRYFFSRHKS
ncbi:MAG: NAD(P)/FAD-dependent oxidoreductase [Chloroflexi bacterium]|nr:NAD(P)/FAD-dependent oxidoreductase [Chloroflexota bacterium]